LHANGNQVLNAIVISKSRGPRGSYQTRPFFFEVCSATNQISNHSISVFVSAPSSQSNEDMRANVSWASDEYNLNPDKHSVNKRGGKKASHEIREDVSRFFFAFFSLLMERINSSSPLFLTK